VRKATACFPTEDRKGEHVALSESASEYAALPCTEHVMFDSRHPDHEKTSFEDVFSFRPGQLKQLLSSPDRKVNEFYAFF
jgi:hypothetical protein